MKGEKLKSVVVDELTKMRFCNYQPIDKTTASGKMLFRCTECQHESPAPTSKRCGLCPACGHHFGTLGHVLNCDELSDEENESLAKLRGVLDSSKAEEHLSVRMRKLAAKCTPVVAARLRKAANELDAAVELGAKAPKLVSAWARARRLYDEARKL